MAQVVAQVDISEDGAEEQKRAFHSLRRVATLLLVLMAAVFVLSTVWVTRYPELSWVQAFAEAAMVGGLADWFAVTALFRQPLGLPIPHTAIIPANKDRVARTMGSFIQKNFFAEEVLLRKLAQLDIANRVTGWLSDEQNIEAASQRLASLTAETLETLEDEEVKRLVAAAFSGLTRSMEPATVAANLLEFLLSDQKHHRVLNELLQLAEKTIARHERYIGQLIRDEMPWYVPSFVHDKVYRSIIARVRQTFADMNADPQHQLRLRFGEATRDLIENLRTSARYKERLRELSQLMLHHPSLEEYLGRLARELKKIVKQDVASPDSALKGAIGEALRAVSARLTADETMRARMNELIEEVACSVVRNYQAEVVSLISDTVSRWDTETITDKLELHVGRDLQYIRLNGTIVGGLAGVVIHLFVTWGLR